MILGLGCQDLLVLNFSFRLSVPRDVELGQNTPYVGILFAKIANSLEQQLGFRQTVLSVVEIGHYELGSDTVGLRLGKLLKNLLRPVSLAACFQTATQQNHGSDLIRSQHPSAAQVGFGL